MSAPSITSITFDKTAYNSGDLIQATVAYVAGTSGGQPSTQTLTGTATDSVTGQSGALTVTFTVSGQTVKDPTAVTVSDSGNRSWAKVSDNGSVAVFTAAA
jgi:hypothetical protein